MFEALDCTKQKPQTWRTICEAFRVSGLSAVWSLHGLEESHKLHGLLTKGLRFTTFDFGVSKIQVQYIIYILYIYESDGQNTLLHHVVCIFCSQGLSNVIFLCLSDLVKNHQASP